MGLFGLPQRCSGGGYYRCGGIEKASFVGEVTAKPAVLFPEDDTADAFYSSYGIQQASDKELIDAFLPYKNDTNDAVCIPVRWFAIDCSSLRMPAQQSGGIRPLNPQGIACISKIISGEKSELERSFPRKNAMLDFTAIDFETGSGYRN
jgi:hypothetical protein